MSALAQTFAILRHVLCMAKLRMLRHLLACGKHSLRLLLKFSSLAIQSCAVHGKTEDAEAFAGMWQTLPQTFAPNLACLAILDTWRHSVDLLLNLRQDVVGNAPCNLDKRCIRNLPLLLTKAPPLPGISIDFCQGSCPRLSSLFVKCLGHCHWISVNILPDIWVWRLLEPEGKPMSLLVQDKCAMWWSQPAPLQASKTPRATHALALLLIQLLHLALNLQERQLQAPQVQQALENPQLPRHLQE